MTKIAIVGSRDYPRLKLVRAFVKRHFAFGDVLVSGGARGVDSEAEDAVDDLNSTGMNIEKKIFLADWERYGKPAGMIRNRLIVEEADEVIAFYDGESRGTANTIEFAMKAGKLSAIYDKNGTVIYQRG